MKFVIGEPAIKIRNVLVIADLHLGIEHELLQKGVWIDQSNEIVERIENLLKITKAKKLLILGDVKHNVPFIKRVEEKIVPKVMRKISSLASVSIVPGNHDGKITELLPSKIEVLDPKGLVIGNTLFLHGHAKPKCCKARTIVIGHNHPLIKMRDELGAHYVEKAWIIGKHKETGQEVIIMPAFSNLVGGIHINEVESEDELLGPIAKKIDLKNAECYLLDGTLIEKVSELVRKYGI